MQNYDVEQYNASSDDDSDYNPMESDSEGENSYRSIAYGMSPLKKQKTLPEEAPPEKELNIPTPQPNSEEYYRQEDLESDDDEEAPKSYYRQILEARAKVTKSSITNPKPGYDRVPTEDPDAGMELQQIAVEDENTQAKVEDYVNEWYEYEDAMDDAEHETDTSTNKRLPVPKNRKHTEQTLREHLKTPTARQPTLKQRFDQWMAKRHGYRILQADPDNVEMTELSAPQRRVTDAARNLFKRKPEHTRPVKREQRASILNNKYKNDPLNTKTARNAAMLTIGLEASRWFSDTIHEFTGLNEQDWWQPHVQSVAKIGKHHDKTPYRLKHKREGTGIRANRKDAENWINMSEEGRMHWIEENHPTAKWERFNRWRDRKQIEWEHANWEHIKTENGKRAIKRGLPEEDSQYDEIRSAYEEPDKEVLENTEGLGIATGLGPKTAGKL